MILNIMANGEIYGRAVSIWEDGRWIIERNRMWEWEWGCKIDARNNMMIEIIKWHAIYSLLYWDVDNCLTKEC